MTIRNEILQDIYIAYGGSYTQGAGRNKLLSLILTINGGSATEGESRNSILSKILTAVGGSPAQGQTRNSLLRSIVISSGGVITGNDRNTLLVNWLDSINGGGGPEFLSQESQASERKFGASSHTFNITAPAETDGAIFVALVQKKNAGVQVSSILIDGQPIDEAAEVADSNPGGVENQMAIFQESTSFGAGAHTLQVTNSDGIEGVTIIAVYYKNFTGLTGNFTSAVATGLQPSSLSIGETAWAVTPGSRGLNVCFAGGLANLTAMTPPVDYDATQTEFPTTDTGDDRYNGTIKTSVDLDFASATSNTQWGIDWSVGTNAEVIMIAGEFANS